MGSAPRLPSWPGPVGNSLLTALVSSPRRIEECEEKMATIATVYTFPMVSVVLS